jgi:hypothetical protein
VQKTFYTVLPFNPTAYATGTVVILLQMRKLRWTDLPQVTELVREFDPSTLTLEPGSCPIRLNITRSGFPGPRYQA